MAWPDPGGIGRCADRARGSMEHGSVALVSSRPAVSLDAPLEPLPLADADHVDQLTGTEEFGVQHLPYLISGHVLGLLEANLAEDPHGRRHTGLLVVTGHRLRHALLFRRREAELKRVIAVRRLGAQPDHRARTCFDHGHRDTIAIIPENLGHPSLATDQPFLHRHGKTLASRLRGV